MTKQELKELVEHEANWLNYYANSEDRNNLKLDIDFYNNIRTGYAKKDISLDRRCVPVCITSNNNMYIDDIIDWFTTQQLRDRENRILSPLESWILRYPLEMDWIIKIIKS